MDVVSFMRSQEGMGSSGQDLAGVVLISFTISDTVTGSKRRSCVAGLGVMSGGVADAVDIRMLATLSWKNVANSLAESFDECCFGGCNIEFTARHIARGFPSRLLIIDDQNDVNFDWKRRR